MYCVYIIHSKSLDMFYVGETVDLTTRLHEHNTGKYKNAYTARANDWELFYRLDCSSREIARMIERHIKRMKSRIFSKFDKIF